MVVALALRFYLADLAWAARFQVIVQRAPVLADKPPRAELADS
jgi:hypothetical protein